MTHIARSTVRAPSSSCTGLYTPRYTSETYLQYFCWWLLLLPILGFTKFFFWFRQPQRREATKKNSSTLSFCSLPKALSLVIVLLSRYNKQAVNNNQNKPFLDKETTTTTTERKTTRYRKSNSTKGQRTQGRNQTAEINPAVIFLLVQRSTHLKEN